MLYQLIKKRLRNRKHAEQRGREFLREMREQFDAYSQRKASQRKNK